MLTPPIARFPAHEGRYGDLARLAPNGSGINRSRLVARRLQTLVRPTARLAIRGSSALVVQMCLTDPLIEFSQRGDGSVGQCKPVLVLSTGWMGEDVLFHNVTCHRGSVQQLVTPKRSSLVRLGPLRPVLGNQFLNVPLPFALPSACVFPFPFPGEVP